MATTKTTQKTESTEVVEVSAQPVVPPQTQDQNDESKGQLTLETYLSLPQAVQETFAPIMREIVEFGLIQRHANLIRSTNAQITKANAVVMAAYARSHSMSWLEVVNRYCVISGKICESANSVRARMRQAGIKYTFVWGKFCNNEETCKVVETLPDGSEIHGETWSLERARQAGLANKDVWRKYPREMLMARATTSFVKAYHPELLVDCQIAEEVRDYADERPTADKLIGFGARTDSEGNVAQNSAGSLEAMILDGAK